MKKIFSLTILAICMSFASFALTPIKGPTSVCVTDSIMLTDTLSPGGTWSSSNTAVATVNPYLTWSAFVTGVSSGVATITYTLGSSYVTQTVTVSPMPAPIVGVTSVCVGSSTTFTDATSGGVWSSWSTYIATIGSSSGIRTGVHAGSNLIMYTVAGCSVSIYDTVVSTYVDTTIYGAKVVCVGATVGLSDYTSGGTWTSSNTAVATINPSTGVVTGVSAGTSDITYAVSGICGVAYATGVMTVISSVSAGTITGASTVAVSGTITLFDAVSGGTWSSSTPGVATVSSTGVVTGVATGSTTITYTVSGCGGSAYTTAVVTVTPFDGISGTISFTGSPYYGPVKVWLITYDPATYMLTAIDSINTYCTSGTSVNYMFTGEPTDSFRVKASADTMTSGYGYIPTYHNSSFYWYAATTFMHYSGTADINKDINMSYGTLTSGPGFIGGNVLTGANKGTSGGVAVGLQMYLLNSTGTLIAKTKTDASGNYTFSSLPAGTYTVFPEALNYKTTAYSSITLTTGSPSMSAASFIQHTVSHTIVPFTAAGVNNTNNQSSVFVFPNPSNGRLNIQYTAMANETGSVTISDMAGRQISSTTINMNQGTGISELNLSNLSDGLYMISVKSESVNYNNKIQIAK